MIRIDSRRCWRPVVLGLVGLVAWGALPRTAEGFTTRIHIALANEVRTRLIDSGDMTVPLRFGNHRVELGWGDAQAITNHPEAFRAGAIGPDNFIFPAMTDPSHAIHLRPYEQCQALYEAAVRPDERAYAIGCFLHGSTDAIAHHLVNYLTGETFTLTPITADRQTNLMNVVRHILAEGMIQDAALEQDPTRFTTAELTHVIPQSFALRMYLREESPVWQMMSIHAVEKFNAAKAADPTGNLQDWILASGQAPADHLVMIPVYLRESDVAIDDIRLYVESEIARLQDTSDPDGADLNVQPGVDGVMGTGDDTTDCLITCPQLYATYFTYVGLLDDRQDAAGLPLPTAFDKIAGDLRGRLQEFFPAYIQVIQNVSDLFNTGLTPGDEGLNLDSAAISAAFAPITDWSDRLTTIDYTTALQAILPPWLLELDSAATNLGVDLGLEALIRALIQPYVDQVKAIIYDYVMAQARQYLDDIKALYDAEKGNITSEYMGRYQDAAPATLGGATALEHVYDAGIWGHAVNIAASTFAQHGLVLPDPTGDPDVGPVSFDASYTTAWMQAGACGHLREAILPFGLDVRALLTMEVGGVVHRAAGSEDAPVECHDGSLGAFDTTPDAASCTVVDYDTLLASSVGSVTRAFPPGTVGESVACRNLWVPGLPLAPPDTGGPDGGVSNNNNGGGGAKKGCQSTGSADGAGLVFALLLGLWFWRRRRAGLLRVGALAGAVVLAGGLGACKNDTTGGGDADAAVGQDARPPADAFVPPVDADTSARDQLLAELGDSVWSATINRGGVDYVIEQHFNASEQRWAELRNPYGPARTRVLRHFSAGLDGSSLESVVANDSAWPWNPDNGESDSWTVEIVPGTPRQLRLSRGGPTETYTEGLAPAPTLGLTAEVRTFPAGSTSVVSEAFCTSATNGFDYPVIFDFARGVYDGSYTQEQDFRVGSDVDVWPASQDFAVTDIDGMRDWGGTRMSEQANFFVRWRGQIDHPGGDICVQEGGATPDEVEDGLWVFLGGSVGSRSPDDLFLEVQGFAWPDYTGWPDDPCGSYPAGALEVEVIMIRCAVAIKEVSLEVSFDNRSTWQVLGDVLTYPDITPALSPSPL